MIYLLIPSFPPDVGLFLNFVIKSLSFRLDSKEKETREDWVESKKMSKKTMNPKIKEEMDVDELIKAAQDELLLKLSVNSHTTTNNLDLDLLHRFQALKSNNKKPSSVPSSSSKTAAADSVSSKVSLPKNEGLDLDTRFNALKNKSGGSATTAEIGRLGFTDGDQSDGDEDDEVEKLIRWAKDAARLDPSPPSDDDDADVDQDDTADDDLEDSDDDEGIRKKKSKVKDTKVKGTKKR
ncbi:calsequestrin-1-like [Papaver somniferum]|uniref:calsequestrin-1-like n=1 Tax=Papaver somniferum TaxID=3469 RepID=UPI000E7019E0|nr:calsequestrin-1-like [Papaver somniferum]